MIWNWLSRALDSFARDTRGNLGMILGVAAVPLVLAVGAAVEYSRGVDLRTRVTAAADAAALAGVLAAQTTLQNASLNAATSATLAAARIDGADAAQKYFDSTTANLQAVKNLKGTPSVEIAGQTVTVSMMFQARVPMAFGAFFNKKSLEIANTVTANSGAGGGQFLDVHVVMDNSASMGVGATLADINAMLADPKMYPPTSQGCAFACHVASEYGYSYATDDYAKTMGYTLRIDVLKSAVLAMLAQANAKKSSADQFRFSLYTFANRLTALGAASTDYAALGSAVNGVYLTRTDGGTNYSYTIGTELAAKLPATSGSGSGPNDRKTVVIIVTDGTENSLDKFHADGAFVATSPAQVVDWKPNDAWGHFLDANFVPFPNWSFTTSSGSKATATYYDSGDFHVQAMNPAICDKLKNKGAAVGVLYVTPSAPAAGYTGENSAIFSFITSEIQTGASSTIEKCASSPNYYASANSPAEISAAMTSLFQKFSGGVARLTR
jgi:Flp pilus assembly protein TadG